MNIFLHITYGYSVVAITSIYLIEDGLCALEWRLISKLSSFASFLEKKNKYLTIYFIVVLNFSIAVLHTYFNFLCDRRNHLLSLQL